MRRIARPLARKGLSVIAAFLLSQFPNFRWDLETWRYAVEIAADRNRSILVVEIPKAPIVAVAAPLSALTNSRRFMSVPLCRAFRPPAVAQTGH